MEADFWKQVEDLIIKLALKNAVKHEGRANPKALVGGVIGTFPEVRQEMRTVMKLINNTVDEINKLSLQEQEEKLRLLEPDFDKPKKKEGLKELPGAEPGKVVLRFEPSPSGPLHVGHAYPLSLNLEYAKKYNGKFILRISDTNPDNIDPDAYEAIIRDAEWLAEDEIGEVIIQSDRMEAYYSRAEELIKMGRAYVCTCDPESFKKLKDSKTDCPCRRLSIDEQVARWERMKDLKGYKPGEAVLRYKSGMDHKNPAMRDFALFRINENKHPRQEFKYRVWPMMNFSVAIDDMEWGITHTLRGKDHADNAKKQAMIHEDFGFKTPVAINVGRINFEGFPVSCSQTRSRILAGEFTGWDDVRIPFLNALRRRGYQPAAFRKYAVLVGVTQNDKSIHINDYFKMLNALNKEIIDPISNRYFFIREPVKIIVKGMVEDSVELDLHPDNHKGGRLFFIDNEFLIEKEDLEQISENGIVRLMECCTIKRVGNNEFELVRREFVKGEAKKIIHWLPANDELLSIKVIMPDNQLISGLAERTVKELELGTIVQFERFGFCKLDHEQDDKKIFCYGHK